MTRNGARLVVLAMAVVVGGWGCVVKTIDRDKSNRPWDRKGLVKQGRSVGFGCRLLNNHETVTLMFSQQGKTCGLTPESHGSILKTKRGVKAEWELCNACDVPIEVTLKMQGWPQEAPGPWLEKCQADKFEVAQNAETIVKRVGNEDTDRIHCKIQERNHEQGHAYSFYDVSVVELRKDSDNKPRTFNTPKIDVGDH
jgi:hypothetical protein